jgi:hypothetical protein
VSAEELAAAAAALGRPIPEGGTRRNVTAAPCELMDEVLGPGAKDALVGLAGVRARILSGGRLAVGDPVRPVAQVAS